MKREKPIGEKDCRIRWSISFLLSILVLLSIETVTFGSAGVANISDSEMKYLDYASVIDWKIYEGASELFAACNETPLECTDSAMVSYYRQMWEGIDPQRCKVFGRLADGLTGSYLDLSVVLPQASESQTPDENGADKMGGSNLWMNGKVQGFGGGHQIHTWNQISSDESEYSGAGIGQVSVTLAAFNVGS